ncbi:MAG: hypothetical protein QOJ64_4562 [Acidobacteriota bacterium]|jgi:tetratricopeptide (TPR) repeat protein|nr:hypothetical protein [Acidobacteriota bacterium]
MKTVRTLLNLVLFLLAFYVPVLRAQDEAAPVWQINKFDITVNASQSERALSVRAQLTAQNIGRGAGSTITLRISPKAEIKAASVGGAVATFRMGEVRNDLQLVRISLPGSTAPGGVVNVTLDYRLLVNENSGLAALSPLGSQFLPLSYWYPAHNIATSQRGADTAPMRITINGASGNTIIASGKGSGSTFDQSLNAQPAFLSGDWDVTEGAGDANNISANMPKGASAEERKQADELIALASSARTFYSTLFGTTPDSPIRLIAVRRGAGFNDAGTVLLDPSVFRRQKLDALAALSIAESVARMWIGALVPVRGGGGGVVREGLTRFLATQFMEKQFGREAAEAERSRERVAYAPIAKRDGPLSRAVPIDAGYYNSTANKGAMIWRYVEKALGRDGFQAVLKATLAAALKSPDGLTLDALRAAVVQRGDNSLKLTLDQMLDVPTDMDLMVGVPQPRGSQWVAALRNTGTIEAGVAIQGVTASGERVTTQATVPARGFSEAVFNARVTRVEVDPEKLFPQLDYSNDGAPRADLNIDPLIDATTRFVKQDFAGAETAAREALISSPYAQEGRIILARALLAQNKLDEAEKEFRASLAVKLPMPTTLAWGNIGLGEISLRRDRPADAAKFFNDAVRADAEYASSLNGRLGRIKAEAAAKSAPAPDDSSRAFIAQLDQTIKTGRKVDLDALIVPGELTTFAKGIVASQPEIWTSRVVRTEQLDANRLAADVSLTTRQLGRDQAGTAVFILHRVGGGWKLEGIELFEVR